MPRRKNIRNAYNDSPGLFDSMDDFVIENPDPLPEADKERQRKAQTKPSIAPMPKVSRGERLQFMSFGSGSSGNCTYLGDDRFGVLIDAGVDPDKIVRELSRFGIDMSRVGGIILTHDHGDHIRYAYSLVRKYRHMRIYCTPRTLNGILRRHNISRRIRDYHQPIFKEFQFHLGNFVITPFETFHDGSDNIGFSIEKGDHRFVVATDMGAVSERADFYIRRATHLMIEANYDLSMLLDGPYPEHLKARILSKTGHMDNAATAALLSEIYTPQLRNVFLCHLSNDNNTPEKAYSTVVSALKGRGLSVGDATGSIESRSADIQVMTLPRFDSTGIILLALD